jgi:hypothetical protein
MCISQFQACSKFSLRCCPERIIEEDGQIVWVDTALLWRKYAYKVQGSMASPRRRTWLIRCCRYNHHSRIAPKPARVHAGCTPIVKAPFPSTQSCTSMEMAANPPKLPFKEACGAAGAGQRGSVAPDMSSLVAHKIGRLVAPPRARERKQRGRKC